MKRPVLAVVAVAGAAAALVTFWPRGAAPVAVEMTPLTAVPVPTAVVVAPPDDTARAPGCHFEQGQRLAYEVAFTATTTVDVAQMGVARTNSAAPPLALVNNLKERLELQVVQLTPAGTAVLLATPGSVTGHAALHPEEMAHPMLLEVDASCSLVRFAHSNAAPLRGARTQQALWWEAQWKHLDGPTGPLVSENGTGAYEATLTASRDERGALVERRISRYSKLWQVTDPQFASNAVLQVRPGSGPWFESVDSQERQTVDHQSVAMSVTFKRVQPAGSGATGAVDFTAFTWANLLPRNFTQREPRAINKFDLELRARVGPLTTDQAVATLTQAVSQRVGIENQWPALSSWLEVHPEKTAEVMGRLRREELPVEALNPFFIALGNARTPAARDELLALKRDSAAPPMVRVRAIFALVDRDDVGVAFAEELAKDSQAVTGASTKSQTFLSHESLLALSSMSGLRNEPGVSEIAANAVRAAVVAPQVDVLNTRVALKALANVGDPALLPLAATAIASPNEREREAAAHVFRRMKPSDTEAVALPWLQRETNTLVRRTLYGTLENQHFDAKVAASEGIARQILRDLPKETSLISRKSMIRLLAGSAISQLPEVRQALKRQARVESDKRTGLLNELAKYLTPEEIREVLQ